MNIKVIKKKNIYMIFISLILIAIGYSFYNFSDINVSEKLSDISKYPDTYTLGDVELVSSQNVYEESGNITEDNTNANSNKNIVKTNIEEMEIKNKAIEKNYFEDSRIERDKMYSENIAVYERILENSSIAQDQKMVAENEIQVITNVKNGIAISENLIRAKGFEDVVIFVNDASASIIIKAEELDEKQIAQIQNIVQKQLLIDVRKYDNYV